MGMKLTEIVNSTFGRVAALISVGTFTYFTSDDVLAQRVDNQSNTGTSLESKVQKQTYKIILPFKEPQTPAEKEILRVQGDIIYMNHIDKKYGNKVARMIKSVFAKNNKLLQDETGIYAKEFNEFSIDEFLEFFKEYVSREDAFLLENNFKVKNNNIKPIIYQKDRNGNLIQITEENCKLSGTYEIMEKVLSDTEYQKYPEEPVKKIDYTKKNEDIQRKKEAEKITKPAIIVNDNGTIKFPQETYKIILKFKEPQTEDEKFVYRNNDIVTYMNWVRGKTNIKLAKKMAEAFNATDITSLVSFFEELEKSDETGSYIPLEDIRTYRKSLDNIKVSRDPTKPVPKPAFYQSDQFGKLIPVKKTSIDGIVLQEETKVVKKPKIFSIGDESKLIVLKNHEFFDFSLGKVVDVNSYELYPYFDGDFFIDEGDIRTVMNHANGVTINADYSGVSLQNKGNVGPTFKKLRTEYEGNELLAKMREAMLQFDVSLDSNKPLQNQDIKEKSEMLFPGGVYYIKSRDRNGVGSIKIVNMTIDEKNDLIAIRFEWRYYPADPNRLDSDKNLDQKNLDITRAEVNAIGLSVKGYLNEKRMCPASGNSELVKSLKDGYFYFDSKRIKDGLFSDMWGRPYVYKTPDRIEFDFYSIGINGKDENGKGDDISHQVKLK